MPRNRSLSQRTLDGLAAELTERRDAALELEARFLDEARENQETADHSDRLDTASPVSVSSEESYALASRAGESAREAELALARIADGTYGVCQGCGGDIPVARLRTLPAAAVCVDCARANPRRPTGSPNPTMG